MSLGRPGSMGLVMNRLHLWDTYVHRGVSGSAKRQSYNISVGRIPSLPTNRTASSRPLPKPNPNPWHPPPGMLGSKAFDMETDPMTVTVVDEGSDAVAPGAARKKRVFDWKDFSGRLQKRLGLSKMKYRVGNMAVNISAPKSEPTLQEGQQEAVTTEQPPMKSDYGDGRDDADGVADGDGSVIALCLVQKCDMSLFYSYVLN